jgi:hypothetical protein
VADLVCPGCGGPLPECPCRSGLTAGTFVTRSTWEAPTLESIVAVRDAILRDAPPPPPFDKVAASDLLTGSQHWVDPLRRVLFVSPEAFAELRKGAPSHAEAPRG